jgi:hypothetical protein
MRLNGKLAKYAYKTVEERRTSTMSGVARGKEKDVGSRRGHKCATDTHSPPLEPNDKQKEKNESSGNSGHRRNGTKLRKRLRLGLQL